MTDTIRKVEDIREITERVYVPEWLGKKGQVNEPEFCAEFLDVIKLIYLDGTFYSKNGALDEQELSSIIYHMIKAYVTSGSARKTEGIVKTLKMECYRKDIGISDKEIHLKNGVLGTDGRFRGELEFCRNRLDVRFVPDAPPPERFLRFLSDMLCEEDIRTLQEYLGYCLIPTTVGQKALFIIGSGGEGKSCIGAVVKSIFGESAVTGNFQAIETDKFSRYKLINKLVMIDDDMQMTALPSTGIIKNLITSRIPVEVEAKGQQSRQATLYSRFICFGNGSPKALYDRSEGFMRRMLILTTKPVPTGRVSDPSFADKLLSEREGIFLWMFEGLRRLIANNYRFTMSEKTKEKLSELAAENCNISEFLADRDFITFGEGCSATSNDLYGGYHKWCGMNGLTAMKQETFTGWLKANSERYDIKYSANVPVRDGTGKRVRGFSGISTSFISIVK